MQCRSSKSHNLVYKDGCAAIDLRGECSRKTVRVSGKHPASTFPGSPPQHTAATKSWGKDTLSAYGFTQSSPARTLIHTNHVGCVTSRSWANVSRSLCLPCTNRSMRRCLGGTTRRMTTWAFRGTVKDTRGTRSSRRGGVVSFASSLPYPL